VIAFYLHSKGRSLFIFTVRGDRFFLAEGREAIAFYLYREEGDRFFLNREEAIAFLYRS
jgi:hypothetical protein